MNRWAEILGVPPDADIELVHIAVDRQLRKVRIEYIGPDGVQAKLVTADEARIIAAELLKMADERGY